MAPKRGHVFKSEILRLEEKYIPEPNSGCWLWTGATNGFGYGRLFSNGRNRYAHRVSFEIAHGPIADDMQLDHLCRNTFCINPDHLEPVTNQENVKRGLMSALRPARVFCPKGHPQNQFGYIDSRGARQCLVCLSIRQKAYYLRKKARDHVL